MKKLILLILIVSFLSPIQAQLNTKHNSIRVGDIIRKQQVEFKDPGEATFNQIWDFSELKLINEEYELEYSEAYLMKDSIYIMGYNEFPKRLAKYADLIVGTEHSTMYYFYQTKDSLVILGHENVAVKQKNLQPIINLKFPLNYGEVPIKSKYQSKGLYSGSVEIEAEGNISMYADAFGKIILPSRDTISPVLRVKTEQSIKGISKESISTIQDDRGSLLQSYRWYLKGYRYPIFETVQFIDKNTDSILFSTAFYFPLQEHHYLDTDPDNQVLLDQLWDYTQDKSEPFKEIDLFREDRSGKSYQVYPNPVDSYLTIEYTIRKDSPVSIMMATIDGKLVKNIEIKQRQVGKHLEQIDCSNFMTGVYLLKVIAEDLVFNERIIKK